MESRRSQQFLFYHHSQTSHKAQLNRPVVANNNDDDTCVGKHPLKLIDVICYWLPLLFSIQPIPFSRQVFAINGSTIVALRLPAISK